MVTKCPYCGEEKDKRHIALCPKNPDRRILKVKKQLQSSVVVPPLNDVTTGETMQTVTPIPVVDNHKSLMDAVKKVWPKRKPKVEKIQKKPPIIIKNPDPNFKPDEKLSESDKLRRFLADAPLWTQYKPQGIRLMLTKIFSSNKTFAPCIFVGENRPPRILYLPYDPERNRLIIPGKGYYFTPTTGAPFFFHEDYMLPLVNSPNLSGRFMIPAHVVEHSYASGLAEGELHKAGEMLEEIKKYKMVCYLLGVITLVALVALIGTAYTYDHNYKIIAENIGNLTTHISESNITRIP